MMENYNNYIDLKNTAAVVAIGLGFALLSEIVCYFLIYRKPEFVAHVQEIKSLWKQYYAIEVQVGTGFDGKIAGRNGRAAQAIQDKISRKAKALTAMKGSTNLIVGVVFFFGIPAVYSLFEGVPVALFPFYPIFPFSMFLYSSTAITTQIPSMCTPAGLFMLTLMLTRQNAQKLFGGSVQSPAAQNPFTDFSARQ